MKLHARMLPVSVLKNELGSVVWRWVEGKDITLIELAQALSEIQANVLKLSLRHERHPTHPDHKADEACDECPTEEAP